MDRLVDRLANRVAERFQAAQKFKWLEHNMTVTKPMLDALSEVSQGKKAPPKLLDNLRVRALVYEGEHPEISELGQQLLRFAKKEGWI